jgi:hypothetical protein
VRLRRPLDPWLGDGPPLATLCGRVAAAVCYGGYRPGLVAAPGSLACDPLQGGLPMLFDLAPGDTIRIGDGVTLTVLAIEGDLIRLGLESPERVPGADRDDERADLRPQRAGWERD